MESSSLTAADLRPSRELNEPKIVKVVIGVCAFLLLLAGGILFGTTEARLNAQIEKEIEMPLAEFKQLPEEAWSVVEDARLGELRKRRVAFGCVMGAGALLLVVALLTKRRLLGASVSSMIIVGLTAGAFAILLRRKPEDVSPPESAGDGLGLEKIIVWAAIGFSAVSLAWAMKVALDYRRRIREAIDPAGVRA